MPHFLGRDYYNEDYATRKELCSRASLTVPHFLKDDNPKRHSAFCNTDVIGSLKDEVYVGMLSFEEDSADDGILFDVEMAPKTACKMETLEWTTKWKNFEGGFIEIVPSSNPESHSSFDSIPDSLPEVLPVEDFVMAPLQPSLENSGQLEEPVGFHGTMIALLPCSTLMQLAQQTSSDLYNFVTAHTVNEPDLSEATVFGKDDLHLLISSAVDKERSKSHLSEVFIEKFEPITAVTQTEAEELMEPVNSQDLSSALPVLLPNVNKLYEVCGLCAEGPLTSPPLPPSVKLDRDTEEPMLKDLVTSQSVDQGVEKLRKSPLELSEPSSFLSVSETDCKENGLQNPKAVLESPLFVHSASSPLQFEGTYSQDASFTLLSSCNDNDDSPLLSAESLNKLKEKVLQKELCLSQMQTLKFAEPQLNDKKQMMKEKQDIITEALQLASSSDAGSNIGRLELDLARDITLSELHPATYSCPEALAQDMFTQPQAERKLSLDMERKLPLDIETIESIVECDDVHSTTNDQDCRSDDKKLEEETECLCKPAVHSPLKENFTCSDHQTSIYPTERVTTDCKETSILSESAASDTGRSKGAMLAVGVSQSATISTTAELSLDDLEPKSKTPGCPKPVQVVMEKCVAKTTAVTGICLSGKPVSEKTPTILETVAIASVKDKDTAVLSQTSIFSDAQKLEKSLQITSDHQKFTAKKTETKNTDAENSTVDAGESCQGVFDLQFDEDIEFASDSLDESPSSEGKEMKAKVDLSSHSSVAFDPVDNFLMLRDIQTSTTRTQELVKGHSVVRPAQTDQVGTSAHPGIITPMSVMPRQVTDSEQRLITVSLSGQFLKAQQEICSQSERHLQCLKSEGILPSHTSFMSLRPDYTRFLLKNRMTRLDSDSQDRDDDGVYKGVVMVHTLRTAAHLLEHCCLESAIVHLAAMQDQHQALTGTLDGLRKTLFHYQFMAQQSGQLHPKVAALCKEIQQHKQTHPAPRKMAVFIQRDQPMLVKTLLSAVSVDGTVAKSVAAMDVHNTWPDGCECVVTRDQEAAISLVKLCTLVVEYEADKDSPLCKACHTEDVHYTGLSMQGLLHSEGQANESRLAQSGGELMDVDNVVTIVGSQQIIQHHQLLQLLETRHNIIVVRRQYANVGLMHYPDAVVNLHKGAVLVSTEQLREEGGLEQLMERLTAVGLQLSCAFVLIHNLGEVNGNMFNKDIVKKIVQLQALLATLTASAKGFTASYKVLLCKSASDIALYIHHLASSAKPLCSSGTSQDTGNTQLPPEMSKEEKFLLGIPCLSPFSCHLLLSRTTLSKILTMSVSQLHSLVPELSDSITENLCRVLEMDRGLRLRPQLADALLSKPIDQKDTCQSMSHPDMPDDQGQSSGIPLHCKALEGGAPCDWEDQTDYHHHTGHAPSQENRKSKCASQENGQHNFLTPYSRSLHYADQPTPFLQVGQEQAHNCGNSRKGNLEKYRKADAHSIHPVTTQQLHGKLRSNTVVGRQKSGGGLGQKQHYPQSYMYFGSSGSARRGCDDHLAPGELGSLSNSTEDEVGGCQFGHASSITKHAGTHRRILPHFSASPTLHSGKITGFSTHQAEQDLMSTQDRIGSWTSLSESLRSRPNSRVFEGFPEPGDNNRAESPLLSTSQEYYDTADNSNGERVSLQHSHIVSAAMQDQPEITSLSSRTWPPALDDLYEPVSSLRFPDYQISQADFSEFERQQLDIPKHQKSPHETKDAVRLSRAAASNQFAPQSSYYKPSVETLYNPAGEPSSFYKPHRQTGSSSLHTSFTENLASTTRRLLQGTSPGYLHGNHNFCNPRTTVHRISIGLAQPLRREDAKSQDSGKADSNRLCQPSQRNDGQEVLSPPLDLDWTRESVQPLDHNRISQSKLKKWSAQLQPKENPAFAPHLNVGNDNVCPSAEKKRAVEVVGRKLTYQPIPGTGGQTRLAFL